MYQKDVKTFITDSCSLEMRWLFDKMGIELGRCSGAYWLGDEDNGNYHLNWTVHLVEEPSRPTHWTHQSAWKLKTIPFTGQLGTYSGGGYVLTMPSDTSLHEGIFVIFICYRIICSENEEHLVD